MSVIYEVNLDVDEDIVGDYLAWLSGHIKEILSISSFIRAELCVLCATILQCKFSLFNMILQCPCRFFLALLAYLPQIRSRHITTRKAIYDRALLFG